METSTVSDLRPLRLASLTCREGGQRDSGHIFRDENAETQDTPDAAVHTVQHWCHRNASRVDTCFLRVDFANAFNTVDRAAMLREAALVPEAFPQSGTFSPGPKQDHWEKMGVGDWIGVQQDVATAFLRQLQKRNYNGDYRISLMDQAQLDSVVNEAFD
ncbi:hypothetical protein AK812_SmicGene801 [Symbiodinium microadriaticum]|uniref:Uncharacterized protein n=1 Tax=Symbiodinium microadriaticum TaxID=2951 RepID=A0A1Q9F5P9_SYMMI|nr:hypothetical protein AK812_SmicGene801 [Symbiodinium microadriaticum]